MTKYNASLKPEKLIFFYIFDNNKTWWYFLQINQYQDN